MNIDMVMLGYAGIAVMLTLSVMGTPLPSSMALTRYGSACLLLS